MEINIYSHKEKILQYIEYKGISKNKFYEETGLSNGFLDSGSSFSLKNLRLILDKYRDINIDWLIFDKGQMCLSNDLESTPNSVHLIDDSVHLTDDSSRGNSVEVISNKYQNKETNDKKPQGVPLIPIDAMAGFGTGSFIVMDYDISDYYVVPDFKDADFMIRVKGSSMYPKYSSGDIVACRKLSVDSLFFQWNKVYVLDTAQGAIIKRIIKANDPGYITCRSENKDYPDFDLNILEDINAIALIVGVIRLE